MVVKAQKQKGFPRRRGSRKREVRKNAREIKKEWPESEEEQACNQNPRQGCARGGFGDLE